MAPKFWMALAILGAAASSSVSQETELPTEPRFSRHLVPLLSRLGCNAGICHGAVKGQNGFKLTLFGADPALDHFRIVAEFGGRRLNFQNPDESLLLVKAVGKIPHEGGRRLDPESPEYRLLRQWILAGAPLDPPEQSARPRLSLVSPGKTLQRGDRVQLQVKAAFPDKSTEDVTAFCTFESRDPAIAQVDGSGTVQALEVGDTIIIARYRGEPLMTPILVPAQGRAAFPPVRPHNFIDPPILARLNSLNLQPAELCDDTTFLRRLTLDVAGALPTPEEIRSFLADPAPDKRARKIDELLNRPAYAAYWATRFCDLLRPTQFDTKSGLNEHASARRTYEWLRARLQENLPYDQLVERILLATSSEGRPLDQWMEEVKRYQAEDSARAADLKAYAERKTLDLYWQRPSAAGVKGTLQFAHAFLGLRLECAQCHRHPSDVWQQDDLLSLANFFMPIGGTGGTGAASPAILKQTEILAAQAKQFKEEAKKLTEKSKDKSITKDQAEQLKAEIKSATEKAQVLESTIKRLKGTEVRVLPKASFASVTSPLGSQKSDSFRLLGEKSSIRPAEGHDPRQDVMAWLRRPENPFFARALVNRVWAHYLGRGIIDPPDNLSPFNPPSHPELLDALASDFVKNRYDLKHLHRLILNSRTYQQSARTNETTRVDVSNYASFYLRRLPAEVLVDAVNRVTGGKESYPAELFIPPGALAVEVAGGTSLEKQKASLHYAFHVFGRPSRAPEVQCDCERDGTVTVVQALFLANHPSIQAKISSPDGRVAALVKNQVPPAQAVEELFLESLSRLPTEDERKSCLDHLKQSESLQRGLEEVVWGLLNTREFQLNH